MKIGLAVERSGLVYVYDEKGGRICTIRGGNNAIGDGLKGYTSGTVSIKRDNLIYIYDSNGRQINTVRAI